MGVAPAQVNNALAISASMASSAASRTVKDRRRTDYRHTLEYRTRWIDNDQYAHLNNSIYYHLFDSVTNGYLATHCAHSPTESPQIGLVVHSHCDYFAAAAFPAVLDVCLRVNKLGKSSVTYEIGVFERGKEEVCAVGEFVHVFVEREGRRPAVSGMSMKMREGLGRLRVDKTATAKL